MSDRLDDRFRQAASLSPFDTLFRETVYGRALSLCLAIGSAASFAALYALQSDPGFAYYGFAPRIAACVMPFLALAFALFPGPRIKCGDIPEGAKKHAYIVGRAELRDRLAWFSAFVAGCAAWAWLEVVLGKDAFFYTAAIRHFFRG